MNKLLPDTRYTVTVVPVYAEGDGPSLSETGKTSEYRGLRSRDTHSMFRNVLRRTLKNTRALKKQLNRVWLNWKLTEEENWLDFGLLLFATLHE